MLRLAIGRTMGITGWSRKYCAFNEVVSTEGVYVTKILKVPSTGDSIFLLPGEWVRNHVTRPLGVLHNW